MTFIGAAIVNSGVMVVKIQAGDDKEAVRLLKAYAESHEDAWDGEYVVDAAGHLEEIEAEPQPQKWRRVS